MRPRTPARTDTTPPADMLATHDTRRQSHQARQAHRVAHASQHGWTVTALPLSATIAERLAVKARDDDELGDQADEAMMALGAANG